MYDWPEVRAETDAFWHILRDALSSNGIEAPDHLNHDTARLSDIWSAEALVLSQCCGWNVVAGHIGAAQPVARPVWDIDGLTPGTYASAIIVRDDMQNTPIADLIRRPAINGEDSWSGCHVFQHWLAGQGHQMGAARVTGAHRASIGAVQDGTADIAAIDVVSLALARSIGLTEGLHIHDWTQEFPSVPYIVGPSVPTNAAFAALTDAIAHPGAAEFCARVRLSGVIPVDVKQYDQMLVGAANP